MRGIGDNVGNTVGRKKSSKAKPWDCKKEFLNRSICCLMRLFIIGGMVKLLIGQCNALYSIRIEPDLNLILVTSSCNL